MNRRVRTLSAVAVGVKRLVIRLIHVDVRQKPSQYCKVIILQLNMKLN